MSAAAPNPNSNLILLAVIGIGAYWLMTRRAGASTMPRAYIPQGMGGMNQAAQSAENAARYNLIGTGVNALSRLIGGIGGSSGQANPVVWDGLTNDGYAQNNPGNVSPFDWWMTNGTGGD